MDPIVNKETDTVQYTRSFSISPFIMSIFPDQRDRFAIIILAKAATPVVTNLVQYLLNCHTDPDIATVDDSMPSWKTSQCFADLSQSVEDLRKKVAIVDLTPNRVFRDTHANAIGFYDSHNPAWLHNMHIRRTCMPNTMTAGCQGEHHKNYSHTIWLVDSLEHLPRPLVSQAQMVFLVDNSLATDYFSKYMGVQKLLPVSENHILVVATTIYTDISIMTLDPIRFSPPESVK